jgi:hypothetical protein
MGGGRGSLASLQYDMVWSFGCPVRLSPLPIPGSWAHGPSGRTDVDVCARVFCDDGRTCLGNNKALAGGSQRGYHNRPAWRRCVLLPTFALVIDNSSCFIGKTLFLIYLLVRLLQLKQVVLFTLDGERVYLFYHEKVYTTYIPQLNAIQPELQLPKPKTSKVFIWSLFDVYKEQEPELLLVRQPCFPVQAASPDPISFEIWSKERSPLHFDLPLWTPKELAQAYVLPTSCLCAILYTLSSFPCQPMYNAFRACFGKTQLNAT